MTIHTHNPEIPLSAATATAKQPTNVNDWFLSQERDRQDVLREDKWMLASAAFDAGLRSGAAANGVTVIGFRCRPMGSTSETEWTHVYHRAPDSFELRECEIQNISIATSEGQSQGVPAAHLEGSMNAGSQQQADSATLGRICELLGIGAAARTPSVILTNISNIQRFSGLLDAVEREFFMVPGEPSDELEDEGSEPDDVCLLNRWGSNQEQYLGQFRQALLRVCLEMGVEKPPAA